MNGSLGSYWPYPAQPSGMRITAYQIAERFVGVKEFAGTKDNPQAFVNYVCWLLRLPRSKDWRARSWLRIGRPISLEQAVPGFDVVILKRGGRGQPGPNVIKAPGHVLFYGGSQGKEVYGVGGNQNNEVNVSAYPVARVLGVRRLA